MERRTEQQSNPEKTSSEILSTLNLERGAERFALKNINPNQFKGSLTELKTHIQAKWSLYVTCAHEWSHALTAKFLGGSVGKISAVAEGNTLGHTVVSPKRDRPLADQIRFFIATAFASTLGEEKIGQTDHRGCGSDLSMVNAYANLGEQATGGQISAGSLKSDGWSLATAVMSNVSHDDLDSLATSLMARGVV